MATEPTPLPANGEPKLKIYFLPNLLTAGNLFCGFVALTKIVEADLSLGFAEIKLAMAFILAACVFDLFDGRVARMVGADSPFGREFDSLADLISFGAAPAFLVHRIVLKDVFVQYAEIGWFIASIYLVCGAFRLARFNALSALAGPGGSKEFLGFPIPSAAALVTSLTLFMIWLNEIGWMEERFSHSKWRYLLPVLMVFLSWMMVSRVKYPSFKVLNLRTTRSFPGMLIAILLLGSIVVSKGKVLMFILPLFFTAYLVYGFIRPRLSRQTRRDIIEEEDEEDESAQAGELNVMPDLPPILIAALTGFIFGLLLCIPVGPINLTIINEGARRGFRWAALIGLGASVMEVIYCAIAFTGFSSFFGNKYIKASMEVFSFVFMLYIGIKFLLAKTVTAPIHISGAADKLEGRIEEKLHPHSAFFTGIVRVMANPGVLLFWIILAVYFTSRDWVSDNWQEKLACVGGVALGTSLWFIGLSWGVSRGHGRFSEKTLLRMEHFSGVGLIGLGLIHGARIAWQLAKHKM